MIPKGSRGEGWRCSSSNEVEGAESRVKRGPVARDAEHQPFLFLPFPALQPENPALHDWTSCLIFSASPLRSRRTASDSFVGVGDRAGVLEFRLRAEELRVGQCSPARSCRHAKTICQTAKGKDKALRMDGRREEVGKTQTGGAAPVDKDKSPRIPARDCSKGSDIYPCKSREFREPRLCLLDGHSTYRCHCGLEDKGTEDSSPRVGGPQTRDSERSTRKTGSRKNVERTLVARPPRLL